MGFDAIILLNGVIQMEQLREHFTTYGDIESINVKTDPNTGRSRGFAFIVFSDIDAIDKVMNEVNHVINGKKVDPKKAKARHGKIFVGGLKPDLSDDDIKEYFGRFGTIVEVELPFDKQKNQRKGFCFITFEQENVVTELLKTPKQSIKGHEVDVKKATPKPDAMGMVRGGMRGAIRGTRGAVVRGRGRGFNSTWNQGGYGGYGQGGYGGYGGYDYGYSGYSGYGGYGGYGNDYYGYGSTYGSYGESLAWPLVAAKAMTGRVSAGGSRRGTSHTEVSRRDHHHNYNQHQQQQQHHHHQQHQHTLNGTVY
ncbi:RNA-binding protein squid [Chionoecetes opilio]|uniref:RNA-binding protein squid n=1 Tax=Chionoecetes opilio TaxID=41210 RepID=A0A8J5C7Z2_CHIOP|nr:RNA-binding protein squid [Chionoecetes opilio]